jgi:hypothetical protein
MLYYVYQVLYLSVSYCLLYNHIIKQKLHKMKIVYYSYLLVFWSSLFALCQAQQGTCYSDSNCYSPVAYSVTKDACFRSLYKGWSRYYSSICETPLFTFGLCSYSFTCEAIATMVNIGYTKYECCNIGTGSDLLRLA